MQKLLRTLRDFCYTLFMFIRIKSTAKSQRKKVQICESVRRGDTVRQVIVRHVGIANDADHLEELKKLAEVIKRQIQEERDGPFLFLKDDFESPEPDNDTFVAPTKGKQASSSEEQGLNVDLNDLTEEKRVVEGFHDIFGTLFQQHGFHQILTPKKSQVLKELVLARIAQPSSKHASQEMLAADFGIDIHLDRIYRMMDSLIEKKEQFEKRVFQATESLCFGKVNMLLFDVTTLYFESVEEDELRKFGYSKDQKFHSVQTVLALATTEKGLPIGYRTFPGNTADVSTLQIALAEWRKVLPIGEVLVVADSAMMSESNLAALEEANIKYVIAAKLKTVFKNKPEMILKKHGELIHFQNEPYWKQEFTLPNQRRVIVTYNEKRAYKDRNDRQRVIEKVQKKIGSGKNTKKLVSNRGYQKFLSVEGEGKIVLNEDKIAQEELWDGLHGVITNDHTADVGMILSLYRRLWVIEESFRINKHDLAIRPVYHFKPERVEAHILLCYLAFALIRYAEHRIELQQSKISIQEIRRALWRTQSSVLKDSKNGKFYRVPSKPNEITRKIYHTFGVLRDQRIRLLKPGL
jgi:transposase